MELRTAPIPTSATRVEPPLERPDTGDVRPVSMPVVDRVASAAVTAIPPIMVGVGMWLGWSGNLFGWEYLLLLAFMYVSVGTGITVGFHRLLTHRSFKCGRLLRAGFAALGSAAAEGPVIDWWPRTESITSSPMNAAT